MISKRALLTATTLTVAAAALPNASALAASTSYPLARRPHSRVVTYDRGDLLVRRLQLQLHRSDHRLRGEVQLAVRNETGHAITRLLRVGPCTGGPLAYPNCRSETTIRVRVAAHLDEALTRHVNLHQPPAGIDTVQAALVVPGARQPYAIAKRSDASLLVRGTAWRGTGAGQRYGVFFHSDDARRLSFDVPAESRTSAYVDVKWTGVAAPSAVTTTISRCAGAACTGETLHPTGSRSGPQSFGSRFGYSIDRADALGLGAGPASAPLFTALLPWPG